MKNCIFSFLLIVCCAHNLSAQKDTIVNKLKEVVVITKQQQGSRVKKNKNRY